MSSQDLGRNGALALARRLREKKAEILDRWRKRVVGDPGIPIANKLPEPLLTDHLPEFLEEIVQGLERANRDSPTSENGEARGERIGQGKTSKDHARLRTWQGYALPESLAELSHLRAVICDLCFEPQASLLPFQLVNTAIDTAMALVAEEIALCRVEEQSARNATEERLRLLLENVKDYGIYTTDQAGCVLDWSQGAEKITGFREEEVLGLDCRIFFTPEDRATEIPEKEMKKAIEQGRAEDIRWHMRKDGSRFWAAGFTTALKNNAGQLRGFSKIFRDETMRKETEEERDRLVIELQNLDKMKDVFLATLSHELRTPLGVISGYVELLRDGYSQDDPLLFQEALSAIERNANIQIQIVSDLLDISRIIAGKLHIEMRPLELPPVIEAAVATVRSMANARKVKLHITNGHFTRPVMGDPGRIQQIVWNLVTNAIKFSPEGSSVNIVLRREDGHVEIRVVDAGRGIHPELLPFVFDRFRQADDPADKRHGGLGLGLANLPQKSGHRVKHGITDA